MQEVSFAISEVLRYLWLAGSAAAAILWWRQNRHAASVKEQGDEIKDGLGMIHDHSATLKAHGAKLTDLQRQVAQDRADRREDAQNVRDALRDLHSEVRNGTKQMTELLTKLVSK